MRRRHLQNGWNNGGCKFAKMLMQPSQAFHSTVLSHWAKAAPEQQPKAYIWEFNENHNKFGHEFNSENFVYNVSNDHLVNDQKISAEKEKKVSGLN